MTQPSRLRAAFEARHEDFALRLDIEVERGRTLALLGPNGAGKSTALSALAGVLPIASGRIAVGERVLDNVEAGEHVPVESRRVGVVFQDYLLFPHLTVLENVAFGPRSVRTGAARSGAGRPGAGRLARREARAAASVWLDRLGIADLASRRPAELSGGQAQRVALARALAVEPELLLLDEPLAALDVEVRDEVRSELAGHLRRWSGLTIVVTHNFDDVAALADDVVVLEGGRVTQRASVRELVRAPATPYVAKLVADWSED